MNSQIQNKDYYLKILLFLPTLSDQKSAGPFDVNRIAIAINNIGAINNNKSAILKDKSKRRFIHFLQSSL